MKRYLLVLVSFFCWLQGAEFRNLVPDDDRLIIGSSDAGASLTFEQIQACVEPVQIYHNGDVRVEDGLVFDKDLELYASGDLEILGLELTDQANLTVDVDGVVTLAQVEVSGDITVRSSREIRQNGIVCCGGATSYIGNVDDTQITWEGGHIRYARNYYIESPIGSITIAQHYCVEREISDSLDDFATKLVDGSVSLSSGNQFCKVLRLVQNGERVVPEQSSLGPVTFSEPEAQGITLISGDGELPEAYSNQWLEDWVRGCCVTIPITKIDRLEEGMIKEVGLDQMVLARTLKEESLEDWEELVTILDPNLLKTIHPVLHTSPVSAIDFTYHYQVQGGALVRPLPWSPRNASLRLKIILENEDEVFLVATYAWR